MDPGPWLENKPPAGVYRGRRFHPTRGLLSQLGQGSRLRSSAVVVGVPFSGICELPPRCADSPTLHCKMMKAELNSCDPASNWRSASLRCHQWRAGRDCRFTVLVLVFRVRRALAESDGSHPICEWSAGLKRAGPIPFSSCLWWRFATYLLAWQQKAFELRSARVGWRARFVAWVNPAWLLDP